MTPGAPTDGARSRFPGHRGPTEAGTTLKDSGKRRHSSKGLTCGSPLIDEAGAGHRPQCVAPQCVVPQRVAPQGQASDARRSEHTEFACARRGPQALACGPLPYEPAMLTATRGSCTFRSFPDRSLLRLVDPGLVD